MNDMIFVEMKVKAMAIAPEDAPQILTDMARFLIERFDQQRAFAPPRGRILRRR